jgi:hypothetical protein
MLKEDCHEQNTLLMLACCLVPLLALGAIFLFKLPVNQVLYFGLILLCPLSHLLMMRGMMHGEGHAHGSQSSASCHEDQPELSKPAASQTPQSLPAGRE